MPMVVNIWFTVLIVKPYHLLAACDWPEISHMIHLQQTKMDVSHGWFHSKLCDCTVTLSPSFYYCAFLFD